ncbi:hypothetical protein ACIGXM_25330 [Kitasatospora sp. NPDC052896]|uniref:hypothetical protein n=1 Tax=Kitasatospora sp. NPDC052896 TaxID=3364061 RepID=UPI0037C628A4
MEQVLHEVLDPEHGILGALTEVTAAATDWVRARVTFDDPYDNPAFALWMRLNGCTSMLTEIHHDLRQAPQEAAAVPRAPVGSNRPEFLQRRRGTTGITARGPAEPSVLSAPGAMDSYDQYKQEQATARLHAARASSPTAGPSANQGTRLNSPMPATQLGPADRTPRTR